MLRQEPRQFRHSIGSFVQRRSLYRFSALSPEDWRQSGAEVRQKLHTNLRKPGPILNKARWIDDVIEVLVQRSQDSVDHSDATARLKFIAGQVSPRTAHAETLFAVARACGSAGLFEGSYGFTQLAHARIELNAESTANLRDSLYSVLVALHRQNLDLAISRWDALKGADVPSGVTREIFDMLDRYMSILTHSAPVGLPGGPLIVDRSGWKEDLRGSRVLILGPGPTDFGPSDAAQFDYIAQIFRNRDLKDFSTGTSANKDILYVGGYLYRMLEKLGRDELEQRFGRFKYFAIKSLEPRLGLTNTRQTERLCSRLFLNGHPNMVPLMCVDLLAPGEVSLHIVGVNFYASKEPYTAGETDAFSRFHLCHSITSHNALENRALVGNFVKAGVVDGEKAFRDVLGLNDLEYLRLLDEYYGKPRR